MVYALNLCDQDVTLFLPSFHAHIGVNELLSSQLVALIRNA